MDISKIIKNRRLELGLTLKDVADSLGVAESTISRYESSNIQNMGIDKIEALAKVLRCSPGYLMGWESVPVQKNDTLAAHLENENFTDDELEEIKNFVEFVKNKRK